MDIRRFDVFCKYIFRQFTVITFHVANFGRNHGG